MFQDLTESKAIQKGDGNSLGHVWDDVEFGRECQRS